MIDSVQFQMEIRKIRRCRSRSSDYAEIGHFMFFVFKRTAKKCTKIYNRTSTAIALLIKPFVWCHSRCRLRRGLLRLPIGGKEVLSPLHQALLLLVVNEFRCSH